MMAARTLSSAPSMLPLYARAAASMIPGASLLPFVPGRGKEIPDVDLTLAGVRVDPDKVAAYAKVCGFALREKLPPTYPHVLAFPLHMAAMADGRFPFGAVGLVHIENRIVQHRPIALGEELEIRVRATKLEPHPRGRTFALLSDVVVDGERVWEGISTMLRRGGGSGGGPAEAGPSGDSTQATGAAAMPGDSAASSPESSGGSTGVSSAPPGIEWRLGGDLGRRYAAVSGDRNPIHMHPLAAKPLGFPRAIAHGMWTKAHCLAALENRLPDAFSVDVRFRKPILLPARVQFASSAQGEQIEFVVKDAKRHTTHLEGRMRPVDDGRNPK
jgi:acyl dehydratase